MSIPLRINHKFRRPLATNATSTTFPSIAPTVTEPKTTTNIIVLDLGPTDLNLQIIPFGTDSADETGQISIIGWRQVGTLWVGVKLISMDVILSSTVGVAGADVTDNEYFADSLAESTGTDWLGGIDYISNANQLIATAFIPLAGYQKVSIIFDIATASSLNCLVATY